VSHFRLGLMSLNSPINDTLHRLASIQAAKVYSTTRRKSYGWALRAGTARRGGLRRAQSGRSREDTSSLRYANWILRG
jgi:hypothetical protein